MDIETIIYLLLVVGSLVFSAIQNAKKERQKREAERKARQTPPAAPKEEGIEQWDQDFNSEELQEEYEKQSEEIREYEPLTEFTSIEEESKDQNTGYSFMDFNDKGMDSYEELLKSDSPIKVEEEEELEYPEFEFDPVKAVIYSEILKPKF